MDNVPAYLLNTSFSSAFADDAVHGLGGVRPPTLSIARGTFTAIDAAGNERIVSQMDQSGNPELHGRIFVDVILIDANKYMSKNYYAKQFDPNAAEFSPPDCWSDNGVAPSAQAMSPQSATCAACPHNVWGSKISQLGKQTKACQDSKKIAVLIPNSGSSMPFLLRIPPASLNAHFAPYVRGLMQQTMGNRKLMGPEVITRVVFDKATQGVLNFYAMDWVQPDYIPAIAAALKDPMTAQIVGKNDQPHQGALPAPAAQPQIAAAAPIPQQAPVQQFQTAPQNSGYVAPAPTSGQPPGLQQMQQQQPQSFGGGAGTSFAMPQQAPVAAQQFAPQPQAQQPQQEPVRRTRRGRVTSVEQVTSPSVAPQQAFQPVQQAPVQQFAPQQGQAPVHPPAAPPFMMGGQAPQQMAQPMQQAPVQQAQAPSHGMVSAPPPTAELAATLANAFGPQGGN